ncbi:hypothetical protein [Brevibacterium oceani]|uniref:hypothetical protein n=1 Tax=Brevibacterium oceani TaxID=358099 RepID=UPI0015E7E51D|nr:hypothetical protein [Brevibacterium oceani]
MTDQNDVFHLPYAPEVVYVDGHERRAWIDGYVFTGFGPKQLLSAAEEWSSAKIEQCGSDEVQDLIDHTDEDHIARTLRGIHEMKRVLSSMECQLVKGWHDLAQMPADEDLPETRYRSGCACPSSTIEAWGAMRAEYRLRDDLFYCLECGHPLKPTCTSDVNDAFQEGGNIHPRGTMTDSEFAAWLGGPFPRAKYFVPVLEEP